METTRVVGKFPSVGRVLKGRVVVRKDDLQDSFGLFALRLFHTTSSLNNIQNRSYTRPIKTK